MKLMTQHRMMLLLVILLGGCDRVSAPGIATDSPPGEYADYVWANPPNCAPDAPGVNLPAAQRDSLPAVPLSHFTTIDQIFYNVALHVPGGWGGFYMQPVNGRNTPALLLVDTTNILAALDTLKRFYPDRAFRRDSVVLRVVRWDWIQLYDWYEYFFHVNAPWDFVYFTDIDEVGNRLAYRTRTVADREAFFQRLYRLNVPCWLVAVEVAPNPCEKAPYCLK